MLHGRLHTNDNKKYKAKRRKLRENLNIEEKVFILTERIRKKNHLLKFLQTICTEHCLL